MKINTLQLMMFAVNLPVSDKITEPNSCNSNDFSTSFNLIKDAMLQKKTWAKAIPQKNSKLFQAIDELINITSPFYYDLLLHPTEAHKIATELIRKYNLPEVTDIEGCYSLSFAVVLITQIQDLPGYSYPMVVDFYRQNNPGMPELLKATVFTRINSENINGMAFEFRDWWKEQEKIPNLCTLFKMQMKIQDKLEELRIKYNLPSFFIA